MSISTLNKIGTSAGQIPVIDISHKNIDTAQHFVKALTEHGFAFIRGQGLGFTPKVLDDMFHLVGWLLPLE